MNNLFSLIDGNVNVYYQIKKIVGSLKTKRRLLELGFVNCKIMILKKSAFRGVFLLQARNFVLALKKKEVANIYVEVV